MANSRNYGARRRERASVLRYFRPRGRRGEGVVHKRQKHLAAVYSKYSAPTLCICMYQHAQNILNTFTTGAVARGPNSFLTFCGDSWGTHRASGENGPQRAWNYRVGPKITPTLCTSLYLMQYWNRMTTPSSFSLDVYMNDSTNPLEPTFDPLGTYVYI